MTSWCQQPIVYGTLRLNELPFVVDGMKVYSTPPKEITRFPFIIRPGSIRVQKRTQEKIFEVRGRIVAARNFKRSSKAAVESALDDFKRVLNFGPSDFYPGFDDGRYYESVEPEGEIEVLWNNDDVSQVYWTVRFLAVKPYAKSADEYTMVDVNASTLVGANLYSKSIYVPTNVGTAPNYPTFQITVPVGGPYGMTSLYIENNNALPFSQRLTIERTFAASDIVIIDTEYESVEVNGNPVTFFGVFPKLDPRVGEENEIRIGAMATSIPTLPTTISWVPLYE